MSLKNFILHGSVAFLMGCGGGYNPDANTTSLGEILQGQETLAMKGQNLKGRGTFRVSAPLNSVRSANHFRIQFLLEDGGQLSLITNANESLAQGIEVQFTRVGTVLKVVLRVGADQLQVDLAIAADQILDFGIDVHNDHGALTHVMLWHGEEEIFSDLLNAYGSGAFWGFRLDQAEVFQFATMVPRERH